MLTSAHKPAISHVQANMARSMQTSMFDLHSLLRDNKSVDINAMNRSHKLKALSLVSNAKSWDPFQGGKHVRDLGGELLIPKHIMKSWGNLNGELRALK